MYSPKIAQDLIPKIYQIAKERSLPMTKLVDLILRESLEKLENERQVETP